MKALVTLGGAVQRTVALRETVRANPVTLHTRPSGALSVYAALGVLVNTYPRKESRV